MGSQFRLVKYISLISDHYWYSFITNLAVHVTQKNLNTQKIKYFIDDKKN